MLRLLQKYSVGCIYLSEKLRQKPVFLLLLAAIAQNRYFLAAAPVRLRDEKQQMLVRSNRCDRPKQVFTRSRACPVRD
ncbi:MAG: hypothetical protein WBA89_03060 [Microcoleus sp.]|uniref:hypothetical protein n=1 Tax=Microcoleus sp. TaxID=44472 RepID=UPI003C748279